MDRKTADRYVAAAVAAGLARGGGLGLLSDELIGQVAQVVRPVRPSGHGQTWDQLQACQEQIAGHVKAGLSVVKVGCCWSGRALGATRTLHRFCVEWCGFGRTVRHPDRPRAG